MIKLNGDNAAVTGLKNPVKAEIKVPGDKSISHRAVMLSAISSGESKIVNLSVSRDNMMTVAAFRQLGVKIEWVGSSCLIKGKTLYELAEPKKYINTGNSGTLTRLIAGILAGTNFFSVLSGDKYLNSRPVERIVAPLKLMGARIFGRHNDKFPPLAIVGSKLNSIYYEVPVASAQVKSCIIFAAISAAGNTIIYERKKTRDHTERFLKLQGYPVTVHDAENGGSLISIKGGGELKPFDINIPGDFSSAAFFIALGLLVRDAEITIKNVLLNERRVGLLNILKKMNAEIEISDCVNGFEKIGTIKASYSDLLPVSVSAEDVSDMIDEFPVFAVVASFAAGKTEVRGAKELRVKETDRIKAIVSNIARFGIKIDEFEDGFEISGDPTIKEIKGHKTVKVDSFGDHRIAMSMVIMGLLLKNVKTFVKGVRCINTSFPDFFDTIYSMLKKADI